jgi:type VI secretion system secreted protein Hcp
MAVDMFLKLEGIDGEALDDKHAGEIDVLSWSWGMSNSGTFHVGGGGGAGKVNVQDINITKYVDLASTPLALKCCNGDHIPSAKLVVRKAGKEPLEYVTIDMKKILVCAVSTGGSGGEDRLTENITLNFAEVKVTYKEQLGDGTAGGAPGFEWNVQKNTGGAS